MCLDRTDGVSPPRGCENGSNAYLQEVRHRFQDDPVAYATFLAIFAGFQAGGCGPFGFLAGVARLYFFPARRAVFACRTNEQTSGTADFVPEPCALLICMALMYAYSSGIGFRPKVCMAFCTESRLTASSILWKRFSLGTRT